MEEFGAASLSAESSVSATSTEYSSTNLTAGTALAASATVQATWTWYDWGDGTGGYYAYMGPYIGPDIPTALIPEPLPPDDVWYMYWEIYDAITGGYAGAYKYNDNLPGVSYNDGNLSLANPLEFWVFITNGDFTQFVPAETAESLVPSTYAHNGTLPDPGRPDPPGVTAGVTITAHPGEALVGTVIGITAKIIAITAPIGEVDAYIVDRTGSEINFTLASSIIEETPAVLIANIGNGTPDGIAYFFLDAETTHFFQYELDAEGAATVYVPIQGVTPGAHTLSISNDEGIPGMEQSFTVLRAAPEPNYPTPVFPPPVEPMDEVQKWVFQAYDFSSLSNVDTYEFEVNPSEVTQSFGNYDISTEAITANNGPVVSWEGVSKPKTWRWKGRVLNRDQYDAILAWGRTNQRIWLTDHFLRRHLIKIENLDIKRVRDIERQWHHEYEITAWILSGDGVSV